ncbi:MAG: hypothetical protein J0H68_06050 [Sphingobacteriia bacterium]|nr:hypothetical protein [Sphingobacteriia bacterium]
MSEYNCIFGNNGLAYITVFKFGLLDNNKKSLEEFYQELIKLIPPTWEQLKNNKSVKTITSEEGFRTNYDQKTLIIAEEKLKISGIKL